MIAVRKEKPMNIFYVNENPTDAAICLPDKLVVKMPLESAQMLSTAHRVLDGDKRADSLGLYKTALERDMKLMGCKNISELSRENLRFR